MRYWLLWLGLVIGGGAFAQKATLNSVTLEGHQRNQVDYLLRFVDSQPGQLFSPEQAQRDVQRLRNLYSVAHATFRLDTLSGERLHLVFVIEEAWTLFPIFSINGVEGNVWYEVGASEINFLGRGMNVTGAYRNIDGRSNYQLFFRQPYLRGSSFGLWAGIHRYASTEPLYFPEGAVFYDYTNLSFDMGVTYEFTPGHLVEFGGVYFIEDYLKVPEQELENPPGPDNLRIPKGLFKLVHRFDRINYTYFYQDGLFNMTLLETVYNSNDGSWFHLFLNDLHYYRRVGRHGNLAFRLRLGLSTNVNSPFAPFVLDSRVNIRGAGNRIDRGTGTLVLNTEYRHTLYEGNLMAIQGVAFSDLGSWRTAGGQFDDFVNPDYIRHFVGPGLRLVYKKAHNAVFRVDYGFDLFQAGEQGLVIGFGQYF